MAARYGVFQAAGMQLALPVEALRELVPLDGLIPLPSSAPGLLGGIDVRGRLLPVIDLGVVLGEARDTVSLARRVIVVAHGGRLLGLAAEDCSGVFECPHTQFLGLETRGSKTLLVGSFPHPDHATLVSVLSAEALLALPGVPALEDRCTGERALQKPSAGGVDFRHTMLFLCAGQPALIESGVVLATLENPVIKPSAVAQGYCLGVIEYGGLNIPVVDLARLCQIEPAAACNEKQVFLVRYAGGAIAFWVDRILDVFPLDFARMAPVPAVAGKRSQLLAGLAEVQLLPEAAQTRLDAGAEVLLVLDAARMCENPELSALAGVITPVEVSSEAGLAALLGSQTRRVEREQVLTYDLGFEVASPIAQFAEILPLPRTLAIPDPAQGLLGLVVRRGQALPVYDLAQILGLVLPHEGGNGYVLVVETDSGAQLGFAVAGLYAIDDAPAGVFDRVDREDASGLLSARHGACWARTRVGRGDHERMRGMLDLKRLARTLVPELARA